MKAADLTNSAFLTSTLSFPDASTSNTLRVTVPLPDATLKLPAGNA